MLSGLGERLGGSNGQGFPVDMGAEMPEQFRGTLNETMRNPMKHTLGTAAKAIGKSKATVHRAIKNGVISANRLEDGSYEIDPAELHRVFQPVSGNGFSEQGMRRSETPDETALVRQENEFLKQQLEREREVSRELSRRLDDEAKERRETQAKLTALLTYQAEQRTLQSEPAPKVEVGKGRLWEKLFGKG